MAKKRINKKVALIGSMVFLLLVLGVVVVILRLSRDPAKFLEDGHAAWLAKDYDIAQRNYLKAFSCAESNPQKIEILFKLADLYILTDQWPKVRGCWEQIISIDPKNVEARLARLKHLYIVADSYLRTGRGASGLWKDTESQASELIEVVDEAGLVMENISKQVAFFSVGQEKQQVSEEQLLGPYLYLIRGRAAFELAKMGAVTVPEESLAKATDDLKKLRQLDPSNVDAYWYLANVTIENGEILASRGIIEEREKAQKEAIELLEEAVEVADNVSAHINLLTKKLELTRQPSDVPVEDQLKQLEPEYLALIEKFSSNPKVYSALSTFYSIYSLYLSPQIGIEFLDKAIEAIKKAIELDKENVEYAISASRLYYRRYCLYQQKSDISNTITMAQKALTLPDARDTAGPRSYANKVNRFMLSTILARCYIEQILEPTETISDSEKDILLTKAEQAVHQIEQIFGTGEEPEVIKWRGMLELARGNTDVAMRKLYAVYEQIKVSRSRGQRDAQLCYTLAQIFMDTPEVGATLEFLIGALNSGIEASKPQAILDYLETLGKLGMWSYVISPTNSYNINVFEQKYGASKKSQAIRINALIGTNQISEAEEKLAKLDSSEPETMKLKLKIVQAKIVQIQTAIGQKQAVDDSRTLINIASPDEKDSIESGASLELMNEELANYRQDEARLMQELLLKDPNSVKESSVIVVCENQIEQGKIDRARQLVNQFLKLFPDSTSVQFYKHLLSEPEPGSVSKQRREELEKQVISNIDDPVRRSFEFGLHYQHYDEQEKALEEFKNILAQAPPEVSSQESAKLFTQKATQRDLAVNYIFDIACEKKDWELAEESIKVARRDDLDGCQGQFYAARLAAAKNNFKDALLRINECLDLRPVFSRAYLLRSSINDALGNEHASLEDIKRSASLNPTDGIIARGLANALYLRNRRLGDNVTSDQIVETNRAFERAIRLNPNDLVLLSFYAEHISGSEPFKALAIWQALQKNFPSVPNALNLAGLAMKMALEDADTKRQQALFGIAGSSLQQARSIDPDDKSVLEVFAEYYRIIGDYEKAQQLLQESEDTRLLWRHYFRLGQFDDAQQILQQLYESQPKDIEALKGLLLVAENTLNQESVKKYSEELLLVEDNVQNRLEQIKAFLEVGLVREAEYKLQSFKEKYPDEPRALLIEAWLAMRQGKLNKALELTNQNLQTDQDSATAWRLRGEINLLMAEYDKAINDFKKSKALASSISTRISLAKAYLKAGREEDAIIELKNTIDEPAAPLQARTLLERIYLSRDRPDVLKRFYDNTLEKFPENAMWYNKAGTFAVKQGEFDRAAELYRKAYELKQKKYSGRDQANVSQDTQYTEAFDGYLQALLLRADSKDSTGKSWNQEKLDEVFNLCSQHVDTALAPIAFYRMAEAKLKLGDKKAAIEYCRKAVDKAGTNDKLRSGILLRMFFLLGGDEVSEYCRQKLRDDPDSLVANHTMFNLAKIEGDYNKAIDYVDKCIELTEPNSAAGVNYITQKTQLLTLAYQKTSDNGYLKKAIADYESLLLKMPNNSNVLNNLAYMLAENNERLTIALEHAKRAFEKKPNDPYFLDTYAYVLCKNGKYSEAEQLLAAALQQFQKRQIDAPSEVYEHLGIVKEKLGEKQRAINAYEQALKIGADEMPDLIKERIKSAIERLAK